MKEPTSLRRLWLLIRNDAMADYRSVAITAGAIAGVMLLTSLLSVLRGSGSPNFYMPWYYGLLFIWGAAVASFSFRELHDKTKNEAYLLLPASALEKTAARLLRSTVIFFVFLLLFMTVTSALIESFNSIVFDRRNGLFDASQREVWAPVGHFLVVVSQYFLGAAWFRRLHFVKTAFALWVVTFLLACFAAILTGVAFDAWDRSIEIDIDDGEAQAFFRANETLFGGAWKLIRVFYYFVLPVFCWYVAWLRVKETQTSHGV